MKTFKVTFQYILLQNNIHIYKSKPAQHLIQVCGYEASFVMVI